LERTLTDKDKSANFLNPDVDDIILVTAVVGMAAALAAPIIGAIISSKLIDKVEEKWEQRQEKKNIKPKWWNR